MTYIDLTEPLNSSTFITQRSQKLPYQVDWNVFLRSSQWPCPRDWNVFRIRFQVLYLLELLSNSLLKTKLMTMFNTQVGWKMTDVGWDKSTSLSPDFKWLPWILSRNKDKIWNIFSRFKFVPEIKQNCVYIAKGASCELIIEKRLSDSTDINQIFCFSFSPYIIKIRWYPMILYLYEPTLYIVSSFVKCWPKIYHDLGKANRILMQLNLDIEPVNFN